MTVLQCQRRECCGHVGEWEFRIDRQATLVASARAPRGDSKRCTCNGCRNFVARRRPSFSKGNYSGDLKVLGAKPYARFPSNASRSCLRPFLATSALHSILIANATRFTKISLPALGLVVLTKTELPQDAAGGSPATAPRSQKCRRKLIAPAKSHSIASRLPSAQ